VVLIFSKEEGEGKEEKRWMGGCRPVNSNIQINRGIKIPNTCKYLKDQNEMNYNQVVLSQYYFLL